MQPDEFRAMRKGLAMSQDALANELGVSRVLVNQMEAGKAPIEKRTELAIRYLNLTMGDG